MFTWLNPYFKPISFDEYCIFRRVLRRCIVENKSSEYFHIIIWGAIVRYFFGEIRISYNLTFKNCQRQKFKINNDTHLIKLTIASECSHLLNKLLIEWLLHFSFCEASSGIKYSKGVRLRCYFKKKISGTRLLKMREGDLWHDEPYWKINGKNADMCVKICTWAKKLKSHTYLPKLFISYFSFFPVNVYL